MWEHYMPVLASHGCASPEAWGDNDASTKVLHAVECCSNLG